jgi:hypothetical protein
VRSKSENELNRAKIEILKNGTTFSDLGTFTLLNTLKVSLGKGPFLLAQTAQLQILILGHMGFTRIT